MCKVARELGLQACLWWIEVGKVEPETFVKTVLRIVDLEALSWRINNHQALQTAAVLSECLHQRVPLLASQVTTCTLLRNAIEVWPKLKQKSRVEP